MTEHEWKSCRDHKKMLDWLLANEQVSKRKMMLFRCACVRRVQRLLQHDHIEQAVATYERFADGLTDIGTPNEVASSVFRATQGTFGAVNQALVGTALAGVQRNLDCCTFLANAAGCHAAPEAEKTREEWCLPTDTDWRAAWHAERCEQARLVRHIFGNPFRPLVAPNPLPASIVTLAEAVYAGEPYFFALRDSLLDVGHVEFADHFRRKEHPRGCAWTDCLLGRV